MRWLCVAVAALAVQASGGPRDAGVKAGREKMRRAAAPAPAPTNSAAAAAGMRDLFARSAEDCFTGPVFEDGGQSYRITAPTSTWVTTWTDVRYVEFELAWPAEAPRAQAVFYIKDWDHLWFQNLLPGYLLPGETASYRVDLAPDAPGWEAREHQAAWSFRALAAPEEVGIHILTKEPYTGTGTLQRVRTVRRADETPPRIRNVRLAKDHVPCYEKFEVTFQAPDRYRNPFDPDEVVAQGLIEDPKGRTNTVDAFFTADYFRHVDPTGERVSPQGPPYWCLRFAPALPGTHRLRLRLRDANGETSWGPATFEADPATQPGYVRVSRMDHRYFEFDNGTPFFPIGHNIRSAFDSRMDDQFPWKQRWPEGTAAYQRYFKDMGQHGENLAEVWMAAWSLGLEWSPLRPGYHGVGQYNLRHAWELDRTVEEAERNGIYLNLVLHNHGKFSTYVDEEWSSNPFNAQLGGYLEKPGDYFTNPRALADFRKLMRYIVARWGYSTHVFAWEFWSELDITGSREDNYAAHMKPEVVEWHRLMSRYAKEIDPNRHLLGTHYSGDYSKQNPAILALPDMDYCPVDGYHFSANPLQIVELMRLTAAHNNPLGKPVLITEFGGSHMAGSIQHLDDALHAALWSSTCIPIGGTPLFWWWQVIEEENFYTKYAALSRFMLGEDRRDPAMIVEPAILLRNGEPAARLGAQMLKNRQMALGWIWNAADFASLDPIGPKDQRDFELKVGNLDPGVYAVEFWDTIAGARLQTKQIRADANGLRAPIPSFARDIAFKVKRGE